MAEPRREGEIFGHPKGLAYLAFTEMWERFSYYGMTALLALYMTKQLLLPGHAEHVVGLAALRHMFELRGPMSDVAFASLIYGWYSGLVYFTPVLGGLVADRWLGTRSHRGSRGAADERRASCDVVRPELPHRLAGADRRIGLPQGQYLGAGRAALSCRNEEIPADARLYDFFRGHQHRRGARAAWLRHGRCDLRLACGLRSGRCADDPRIGHLSRRASAICPARLRRRAAAGRSFRRSTARSSAAASPI